MKTVSAQQFQQAQSVHGAQTVADDAVNAALPLTSLHISRIAGSVHSGDGDESAPASEQPFRSSLVSAVLEHLRETRMKKSRQH